MMRTNEINALGSVLGDYRLVVGTRWNKNISSDRHVFRDSRMQQSEQGRNNLNADLDDAVEGSSVSRSDKKTSGGENLMDQIGRAHV